MINIVSRKRFRIISVVALAALVFASLSTPAMASHELAGRNSKERARHVKAAMDRSRYLHEHPGDYVGLWRMVQADGFIDLRLSIPALGLRNVSPMEASARHRDRMAVLDSQSKRNQAGSSDLPPDIFEVFGMMLLHPEGHVIIQGDWNFRDNFIGTGDPDDASAVGFSYDPRCYLQDGDSFVIRRWDGGRREVYHSFADGSQTRSSTDRQFSAFLKSASPTGIVRSVDDWTSEFQTNIDNGSHLAFFQRQSEGCSNPVVTGSFHYEHNQDGGNAGWTFSLGAGFFSIGYSGPPPQSLQKSTPLMDNRG